jgi:ABC-type Na+ efflux pump permease subunit
LIEHAESSIEPVFLVILVTWITLIFVSFGYNAPVNATVVISFLICAGALAACLFVIVEMDGPFDGVIAISSRPMRDALAHMTP